MSCGLGAVILLFVLLKYDIGRRVDEEDNLSRELASLQLREQQLNEKIKAVDKLSSDEEKLRRELIERISKINKELETINQNLSSQEQKNQALKESIEATPIKKSTDVVEDPSLGEEQYLLGLKVEGPRIAILIDHSASMTDVKLIDIISRKTRSDPVKIKGPKWLRTKKIVRWLLARLPDRAEVAVIAFNNKARNLGPAQWVRAKDANALEKIIADVDKLIPVGPTNLQEGLDQLSRLKPRATNLYLITDGLPTMGNSDYGGIFSFVTCSSLLGKSTSISGECRKELYRQTLKDSGPSAGTTTNVILLPIEGDPEASPEYWSWTAATGGLLITPAEGWP
ncbi:MAG: hypothetical protein CMM60_04855 [Rhodospirillaceae bacterium]|nr:hypothetical protein [Rhodospirillaceae bacterium]